MFGRMRQGIIKDTWAAAFNFCYAKLVQKQKLLFNKIKDQKSDLIKVADVIKKTVQEMSFFKLVL